MYNLYIRLNTIIHNTIIELVVRKNDVNECGEEICIL